MTESHTYPFAMNSSANTISQIENTRKHLEISPITVPTKCNFSIIKLSVGKKKKAYEFQNCFSY